MRDCVFKSANFHVSKKAISQSFFNIARFARLIFSKLFCLKTWNSLKLNLGFPSCWRSFLYLLVFTLLFILWMSLYLCLIKWAWIYLNIVLPYDCNTYIQIYNFWEKNLTSFENNFAYYWVIWSWIRINLN